MIRADFEIVFSLLILGYYVYTFIAKNKEKSTAPQTESTPPVKKKKSFVEEFLEELEKQQKANIPKTEIPAPEPVVQKRNPNSALKPKKAATPRREPVAEWAAPEMEGGLTTMTSSFAQEKPVPQNKKQAAKIVLGNTVLSPKDAVVAQILFERRF